MSALRIFFPDGTFRTMPGGETATVTEIINEVFQKQGFGGSVADFGLFERTKGAFRLMEPTEKPADVKSRWPAELAEENKFVFRLKDLSPPSLKQGYLTKQGHFVKNWKRRWYRMVDGMMLYFRNHKDKAPAGAIPLKGAKVQLAPDKIKKKFCFLLVTADGQEHYAYAASQQEMEAWILAIQQWIEHLAIEDLEKTGVAADGTSTAAGRSGSVVAAAPPPQKVTIEDFDLLKVLGKGSFGKVMLGKKKGEDKLYAIKILKKDMVLENEELEHTKTERHVLQSVIHPFLVRMYFSFQTSDRLYFVMDYVNGGELFYHMQREGKFSEDRARFYSAEIICGLQYLHSQGIVYRDLKLENLLLDAAGHILLTDFGLCKTNVGFGNTTNTFCGTPEYLAPEVVEDEDYGIPVDWWSMGVVMYEMMTGRSPFSSTDHEELFRQILEAEIYYPATLSAPAKDMLQSLLVRDPKTRLGSGPGDAEEIKAHPFFSSLDWGKLEKRELAPPFVPNVAGADDTSNFDPMFTTEQPVLTPPGGQSHLSTEDQGNFQGFTYVAGSKMGPM